MNEKITNLLVNTRNYLTKHSPEILTGVGIAGLLSTTVLAVKATPKALKLIDKEIKRQNDESMKEAVRKNAETCAYIDKLKTIDIIKTCWKPYIPAASSAIFGITCIIGAISIRNKRSAALATSYAIAERSLSRYRDKVIETIGDKKEKEIREKLAQDEVDNDKPNDKTVIITSKGNTLCKDSVSGRYFRSDIDLIKNAINALNRRLNYEHYISLNELYGEIGLDSVKNGDVMGWNLDQGLIELTFDTCLAENDEPCVVIDYSIGPRYDFDKLM